MRKIIFAVLLSAPFALAACGQTQPAQPVQEYTATPVNAPNAGCDDADDRYEYDTDCGYTEEQESARLAYLAAIGYAVASDHDSSHRRHASSTKHKAAPTRPTTSTPVRQTTASRPAAPAPTTRTASAPTRSVSTPAPAPRTSTSSSSRPSTTRSSSRR